MPEHLTGTITTLRAPALALLLLLPLLLLPLAAAAPQPPCAGSEPVCVGERHEAEGSCADAGHRDGETAARVEPQPDVAAHLHGRRDCHRDASSAHDERALEAAAASPVGFALVRWTAEATPDDERRTFVLRASSSETSFTLRLGSARDGSGCTSDTEVLLTGGSLFRFEDASCTTEPPAPPEPVPWGDLLPLLA